MRKYINISEVSKQGLQLSEYDKRTLDELRREFAHFAPICTLVEVADVSEYDGKRSVSNVAVFLDYKGHLLRAYKCHYTDKAYRFYLVNPYRHKHTQSYRNNNEKPNKVGKPTAKKMDEWLAYLLNEEEERKAYAQKYIDEETAFRAELAELGDAVKWWHENTQGHIYMNNLIFSFSIEPCYIKKDVRIDQTYDLGLSGFLQMADNKYCPHPKQITGNHKGGAIRPQ